MTYTVGQDIEAELAHNAPPSIRIIHKQDIDGCCHPAVNPFMLACFCPILKKRTINWVAENALIRNTPVWCLMTPCCTCCSTCNITTMALFSSEHFDPCCNSCGAPLGARGFATQRDMTYLCYCIPCECLYNICTKPCYGEALWMTPCENGTCCFDFGTRCCGCCMMPFDWGMADSESCRSALIQQIAHTRKKNLTAGQMQVIQKSPPPMAAMAR